MPRVSVLLPAYNAEKYVDAALGSIAAQTFTDWEVAAVDDASTDRTFELLSSWHRRDRRIRAERNSANLGMTANWNRCLSLASGELVIKLDADDVWRPQALAVLVEALHDKDVMGAGMRTLACDERLEPIDGLPADDAMMRAGLDPYQDQLLDCERWYRIAAGGHQLWHSCAFLLRRSLLNALGGFDERFGCASDTDLLWRVLERPGKFVHRGTVGVLYRLRAGSISNVFRANRWLRWEGIIGNLASLHRWRQDHRLSRHLRLRYVELWRLWRELEGSGGDTLPPEIFRRLSAVAAEAAPPPLQDRLLFAARQALAVSS